MNIHWLRRNQLGSASTWTGLALSLSLLSATPAAALDNASQLLMGGTSMAEGATVLYFVPGTSKPYSTDFPNTGLGEQAAEVRMPAGTLSQLRVSVVTQNVPTGGTFEVMVRKNGNDTTLKCSVTGTGNCTSSKSIALSNNTRVAIQVTHDLVDSGNTAFTYSLVYD